MTPPPVYTMSEALAMVDRAKGVIFDNDGTLVDTMPSHYFAYVKALAQFDMHFSQRLFYDLAGVPASAIISQLKREQNRREVSVDAVLAARDAALLEALREVRAVEPVQRILRHAKNKGLKVGIASGGERRDVLASLKGAGIDVEEFDALVTREDVVRGKPDPECFLEAARRMGVGIGECVGLEDGELGMEGMSVAACLGVVDVRALEGYPKGVTTE